MEVIKSKSDKSSLRQEGIVRFHPILLVMKKKYRSNIAASIHETADGLHEAGLMDKLTMDEFDALCLTPVVPMAQDEISIMHKKQKGHLKNPSQEGKTR